MDTSQNKRPRLPSPNGNNCDAPDSLKRKQVDAHVQAFLKAVLDRADGSFAKSKKRKNIRNEKRDAETQTDFGDIPGISDLSGNDQRHYEIATGLQALAPNLSFMEGAVADGLSQCVPNRAMYSRETLQFVSQKDVHHNMVQHELFSNLPDSAQYYTADGSADRISDVQKCGRASPEQIRRVINQWVEKYERWFYQNFGVDVKTVSNNIPVTVDSSIGIPTSSPAPSSSSLTNNSISTPSPQPNVIVSRPAVSYVVPEGSLYVPENRHSTPYFSLLPSFYTSAAFGHSLQQTQSQCQIYNPISGTIPEYQFPQATQYHPGVYLPNSTTAPHFVSSADNVVQLQVSTPQLASCPVTVDTAGVSIQPTAIPTEQTISTSTSLVDLPPDVQTSALLAALSVPLTNTRHPSLGQWGPLLRCGTYGRLPSTVEIEHLSRQKASMNMEFPDNVHAKKMPPPPPTFILLRRQAMICALQLSLRDRARELFLREKESRSGIKIDYVSELDVLVEKSIDVKPVYLFSKLNQLPAFERAYFLPAEPSGTTRFHNEDTDDITPVLGLSFSVEDMYVCDLLIGDVLIAEACATFKLQAQTCVARQAFRILSQPCFLVGSVRCWEGVEYLVLCLSPKAELVPQLPPFLSDPFESLSKKDRCARTEKSDEGFEVVNSKSADDLWLFIAKLPTITLDDISFTDRILAQSAEFSQMTISFEVETNMQDGLFSCCSVLDNVRYPPVSSSSVKAAQRDAAVELLSKLKQTQPVVDIQSDCIEDPGSLWGVPECVLVDTLMWGKEERHLAVPIEQLEAHCDVPALSNVSPTDDMNSTDVSNPYRSSRHLDNLLQAYATSALVTPIRLTASVVPFSLWPLVRQLATNWGLLSQLEHQSNRDALSSLLVCKRTPLPSLKRTLYEHGSYGCFRLFHRGNLSDEALKALFLSDPLFFNGHLENECSSSPSYFPVPTFSPRSPSFFEEHYEYSEEPVTRLARHFVAASAKLSKVKSEPESMDERPKPIEDCVLVAAELNQPSNAIEILDDLPRTLIPGIDF